MASRPRRPKPSLAERREEHAAIDDPAVVLEAAARFLEARARSIDEVRRRLGRAGYRPELVEGAIGRLAELGMLDDATFARAWVESRDRARPRGERALRHELALKGIDRELSAEILEQRRDAADADGPGIDVEAARRVVARNARALERAADPRARRQRAYALLARNGFDAGVCAAVSAESVRDAGDEIPAELDVS